ncbi:Arfaptin (AH) domain/BAR domain [Trinorchestia longiramus]|nr:Arfaptin (AH) domain/BAR domain [Trinorchestia longiramus]
MIYTLGGLVTRQFFCTSRDPIQNTGRIPLDYGGCPSTTVAADYGGCKRRRLGIMAKTHMKEDEEDPSCESTRGKESKFVAERSETGMDGNRGSSGSGSANSNNDSQANESDRKNDANRNRAGGRGRYRVPSNFCRDFIFYSCKRRGCKFIHPAVDSAEYKEARASRPELVHRERERSRSPLPEVDSSGKPTVCRDFLRNMCYRGKDCRYKHPSDGDKEDLPWPQLCIDYRSGNCKRYDCRFLHYTTDDEEYFMRTGTVRRELWQHFISITLKDSKLLKSRPVCKLFMQSGDCTMDVCRYRHVTQREYEEEMFHVICQMVFEKCRRINPDIPPPSASLPLQPEADLPPPPRPTPFHDYEHETSRRDYDWPREPAPPRDPYGFPKPLPEVLPREVDQLTRENMDLRRIISDDSARFKVDIDRLNMENAKLQEQLNYVKSSGAGALPPQMSLLQQEHAELSAKVKSLNDWNVELQAKYSTTRRECDEMRDSVKVLNLELATVNEEKVKLKRKSDELEAKLQVAQAGKEEASLAIEKKEYLESKLRQYYDTMKRCEAEFVSLLEKNFHINTPNVMSYFPSWGYLMTFVTDIVNQINSTVPTSTVSSMATAVPSSYSYSGYNLPPPSVTSSTMNAMPYGSYPPADYSTAVSGGGASFATQQQPQAQSNVYGSGSNAYPYGGGYPSADGMYGSSNSYGTSSVPSASTNSSSVSDVRKAVSKKDNHLAPPPWKSDAMKRDRHM